MIKFDTTMGADYLNQQARQRADMMKKDESLTLDKSSCINPECGIGDATIGFEQDPPHRIRPLVTKACCQFFKIKINKKIGARNLMG